MPKTTSRRTGRTLSDFETDLIADLKDGKPLLGAEGSLTPLIKMALEAALEGEMDAHLADEKEISSSARRNGKSSKRLQTTAGAFELLTPRDRDGDFEPEIVESDGKQHVIFAGSDMLSGVDHYEVTEIRQKRLFGIVQKKTSEEENWKVAESPFVLEDQSLDSIVKVKTVDRAGNAKLAEIVPSSKIRIQDAWPVLLLILLVIGVMVWILRLKGRSV